jgi:hypothetical protein
VKNKGEKEKRETDEMDEAMAMATAVKEGASSPTTTGSACLIWYLTRYKRKAPTTHYD